MTVHHNWNQMLLIWSVSNCFSLLLLTQEPCAIMPPLELFMEVSYDERRAMLYRDLERGDVVVGRINNIREYGFFLTLLCTAMGLKRDIEDLELSVGSPDAFVFIIHTSTMSGLFPFLKSSFNFWRKKKFGVVVYMWCMKKKVFHLLFLVILVFIDSVAIVPDHLYAYIYALYISQAEVAKQFSSPSKQNKRWPQKWCCPLRPASF